MQLAQLDTEKREPRVPVSWHPTILKVAAVAVVVIVIVSRVL
jgi:hypothetical protein